MRRTGGLADTVADGVTGFVFDGADDAAVAACVDRACDAWWMEREAFERVRAAGMGEDVSWEGRVGAYVEAYKGGD